MNRVYLIRETGREDSYTFVGRESDMKSLVEGSKDIQISYPGSEKDVWVSFKYSNSPEIDVEPQAKKNKFNEWLTTILFFSVPILALYGAVQLVKNLFFS